MDTKFELSSKRKIAKIDEKYLERVSKWIFNYPKQISFVVFQTSSVPFDVTPDWRFGYMNTLYTFAHLLRIYTYIYTQYYKRPENG